MNHRRTLRLLFVPLFAALLSACYADTSPDRKLYPYTRAVLDALHDSRPFQLRLDDGARQLPCLATRSATSVPALRCALLPAGARSDLAGIALKIAADNQWPQMQIVAQMGLAGIVFDQTDAADLGEVGREAHVYGLNGELATQLLEDLLRIEVAPDRRLVVIGRVGVLAANDEVAEAQLTQYIFMAGFSTADEVTQISGRGVGMDVVRSEIVSLGGRIDISSTPGRGTSFTIALPLTLAVTQAVMVVVNDTTYAIPSVMIEQVQEYKGKRYEPLLEMNEIDWKGNKYPLRSMEAILGGKPTISAQRKASVMSGIPDRHQTPYRRPVRRAIF